MNQKTNNIGLDYGTVVECFANIVRTYIQFLALYFFYVFSLFFTLFFIDFIELFNFFHFKQDTHTKEKTQNLVCCVGTAGWRKKKKDVGWCTSSRRRSEKDPAEDHCSV